MTRDLEEGLRLTVLAGEQDIHHARPRASGEKAFHRRRHNLRLRLACLVGPDQRPEAVQNNVHRVAHFGQFFFALHGAGHVELLIEWHQLQSSTSQFAVIAHRHHEIHAVHTEPLPSPFDASIADPLPRHLRPNLLPHPRLALVANPARFSRKHQRRLAVQRKQHVHVAMDDLKTRQVEHRALETCVLVSADQQCIQAFLLHLRPDVLVPALHFLLARHVRPRL